MKTHATSVEDVVSLPHNAEARTLLVDHLRELSSSTTSPAPTLAADFTDFSGADLSGLELSEASFLSANLANVGLRDCCLRRANLSGADLRGADLSGADMFRVEGDQCLAQGATLRDTSLVGASLPNSVWAGADMRRAILNSAFLWRVDFTDADLRGAYFLHCRLGHDDDPLRLSGTKMFGCSFDSMTRVSVLGPVDVGEHTPSLLEGSELETWFREHGAGDVRCLSA